MEVEAIKVRIKYLIHRVTSSDVPNIAGAAPSMNNLGLEVAPSLENTVTVA